MKKKVILVISFGLTLLAGYFLGSYNKDTNSYENTSVDKKVIKSDNMLSMMLETDVGSGEYAVTQADSWPTEGYIFNKTISKCQNGSELAWDDTNKVVTMTGNTSDRCYVYFNKLPGDIDVNFVGSTSTTLKINVVSEDGSLSTDYDTYYYSVDGGTTYVSSEENTYSFDYTAGTISSLKIYANNNVYGNSNAFTKNVFNGGTVGIIQDMSCSNVNCGYYGALEPTSSLKALSAINESNVGTLVKMLYSFVIPTVEEHFAFNNDVITGNMDGYLFNNSTLNFGHVFNTFDTYYMRFVGTSAIKKAEYKTGNKISIESDTGNLSITNLTTSSVSNIYFGLVDTTLNMSSSTFTGIDGDFTFNLSGTNSISLESITFVDSTILVKLTGNSNFISSSINSLSDLSSDAKNLLSLLVSSNVTLTNSTMSFDFNGYKFTYDEAKSFINS